VISSAPATIAYGTAFTVSSDGPNVARATLVRLSSVTHSTNFDQRFIELPILARNGNNLTLSVNTDRFVTQPGYYMLFVFDAQGVPSVSKILQLQ
jgi:galactose oxidase